MVMPNQMDMMMGLMDQVKRMRQPDERGGKPGRELYGPWALTGFTRKSEGLPAGEQAPRGAGIQAYAQQPAGAEYDQQIGAIDEEITNLRRQLAMVQTQLAQAVQNQDQYRAAGLRETINALKEQIAALQQDRERIQGESEENTGFENAGGRGGMGTRSSGGIYGGPSRGERREQRRLDAARGRPWWILNR